MLSEGATDRQAQIDAISKNVAENSIPQFLGVLEENPGEVCYFAILMKLKAENGAAVIAAVVTAFGLVRNKPIQINFSFPYTDATSISTGLANAKIYYADLVAANK
jgi:hypothetical protein